MADVSSIPVTHWWIMPMVCRLSITLTTRRALNGVKPGGYQLDINNIAQAYATKQLIDELIRKRSLISEGRGLSITIQSTYQDDEFLAAMFPYVLSELDRRIAAMQKQMENLGVVFPNTEAD